MLNPGTRFRVGNVGSAPLPTLESHGMEDGMEESPQGPTVCPAFDARGVEECEGPGSQSTRFCFHKQTLQAGGGVCVCSLETPRTW